MVREWVPVSTSPKGRLALAAVQQFGSLPFGEVTVGELAAAAGVTTGAIYHHFGSKLGLYDFVRTDIETRLLDRIEGAVSAGAGITPALVAGFDFAVRHRFLHLLGAPPSGAEADRLARLLADTVAPAPAVLGGVLAAAWRAAVAAVAVGSPPDEARAALAALTIQHPR